MVKNYILVANNTILDIFPNSSSYPIFAPYDIHGNKIECLTISTDKMIESNIQIGNNIEVITNEDKDVQNISPKLSLNLTLPTLLESNGYIVNQNINEIIDNYTLQLINLDII